MNFYLIGVDYKSAPPEIRQNLYRQRSRIGSFWKGIAGVETVILVTCNRFDINLAARAKKDIFTSLELFKKEFPEFGAYSYVKENKTEVLRYGLRLACGLESQLKGELQILEQLCVWLNQSDFSQSLFRFWRQIVGSAAEIRKKSGLYSQDRNIAKLLFEDLKSMYGNSDKFEMAVLGTGNVAGLLADYKPDNAQISFIAHKNRIKAEVLAKRVGARVLSFDQLGQVISRVQVLVSAASSPHVILKSGDIPDPVLLRDKPLYIYDLGFPENVDKELKFGKNIILKNLDDLISSVKNMDNYRSNLKLAEYLIEERIGEIESAQDWHAAQPVSR